MEGLVSYELKNGSLNPGTCVPLLQSMPYLHQWKTFFDAFGYGVPYDPYEGVSWIDSHEPPSVERQNG